MPVLKKHESKRSKQDRDLRTALEALNATITFSTRDGIAVKCPPQHHDAAREIMREHGFIV